MGKEARGDIIEVPIASALMNALIHNSLHFQYPDMYKNRRLRNLNKQPIDYDAVQALMDPFYAHYICADKRPFYVVAPGHLEHQMRTLQVLQLTEKVRTLKIPVADPYQKNTQIKYGLGANQVGDKWAPILRPLMQQAFLKHTSLEWENIFGAAGIPGATHRTTNEWIKSPHALDSGLIQLDNDTVIPAPIAWLENGENIDYTDPIDVVPKGWMDGIQIIDLTNVIAGPTIGKTLARFGARVIKIDPTIPSYAPCTTIIYGVITNIGKESVLLDISTDKGREVLKTIIKDSDVIVMNATSESIARLRLTPKELREINPNIILARFDAWGGPKTGPMTPFIGYDDNVQAALGIMIRFGGSLETVEEHAHIGTIDVIAGVAGALSVVNALLHRLRYKKNVVARTSLAALGQMIQLPFICGSLDELIKEADTSPTKLGIHCKGEHPFHMCYETQDKEWIILVASLISPSHKCFDETIYSNFQGMFGISFDGISAKPREKERNIFIETQLKETFKKFSAEELLHILTSNNIAATKLQSMKILRRKYNVNAMDIMGPTFQFFTNITHPIGPLTTIAPLSIRTITSPLYIPQPNAPQYGEHTTKILTEYGANTADFINEGIAVTKWSNLYLPYSKECPGCYQCMNDNIEMHCGHILCTFCAIKI